MSGSLESLTMACSVHLLENRCSGAESIGDVHGPVREDI